MTSQLVLAIAEPYVQAYQQAYQLVWGPSMGQTCASPENWRAAPTLPTWTGNCGHCGHRYNNDDRSCPQCGGPLPA